MQLEVNGTRFPPRTHVEQRKEKQIVARVCPPPADVLVAFRSLQPAGRTRVAAMTKLAAEDDKGWRPFQVG